MLKVVPDAHQAKKNETIEIFGWIFDFFPFKHGVKIRNIEDKDYSLLEHEFNHNNETKLVEEKTLVRNDTKIYEDSDFSILPGEMIEIDATYKKKMAKLHN